MSISFVWTTSQQRRLVADGIVAASFIEEAKGAIISLNRTKGFVSRGPANSTSADFGGATTIPDLKRLEIDNINGVVPEQQVSTGAGIRFVDTKVFDAAYKATRISFDNAADYQDLPPSFYISGQGGVLCRVELFKDGSKSLYRKDFSRFQK